MTLYFSSETETKQNKAKQNKTKQYKMKIKQSEVQHNIKKQFKTI